MWRGDEVFYNADRCSTRHKLGCVGSLTHAFCDSFNNMSIKSSSHDLKYPMPR